VNKPRPESLPPCIVAEGCADAIFGRPAGANPYARDFEPAHSAWAFGHREGRWLLEQRGVVEARRWLRERAA
jgi:hypothetical protein